MNVDNHLEIALKRAAEIEGVSPQQLATRVWQPPEFLTLKKHRVWIIRNKLIEPPLNRRIAVNTSTNATFWVNNPNSLEELASFWNSEDLNSGLTTPDVKAETFLALNTEGFELLRSLKTINADTDKDLIRVEVLKDRFYQPKTHEGDNPSISFWTWSLRTGNVEIWSIWTLGDKWTIKRKIEEKQIGVFLHHL